MSGGGVWGQLKTTDATQPDIIDDRTTAYEEAAYHATLSAFEELLHKHGLQKLLVDMSDESVHALLMEAYDLEYGL